MIAEKSLPQKSENVDDVTIDESEVQNDNPDNESPDKETAGRNSQQFSRRRTGRARVRRFQDDGRSKRYGGFSKIQIATVEGVCRIRAKAGEGFVKRAAKKNTVPPHQLSPKNWHEGICVFYVSTASAGECITARIQVPSGRPVETDRPWSLGTNKLRGTSIVLIERRFGVSRCFGGG